MICWQLVVAAPHQRSALLFTLPWLVRLLDHQFLTAMEFIPVWWNKAILSIIDCEIHDGLLLQGVPYHWTHFLGFWNTYRGPFDHFSTALEICYMIATKILKIDTKIAEIIEVKVGTRNTKITFFTLRKSKMSISKWRVPTLTSII